MLAGGAQAATLDHGVDPASLGRGDWIYYMDAATNHLGGNAPSVTDVKSLMAFYKEHQIDFVVVKAGTGPEEFPSAKEPQFTADLVKEAHTAGLKIFAYDRSDGKDVPGEIKIAVKTLDLDADGFVIDGEVEWEAADLHGNAPALAEQLCEGIKKAYPNRFLAHAPLPIISAHPGFPYQEFGLHCDAVMPQAYWKAIGVSPKRMMERMEGEFREWHKSLKGKWTGAIKPIAPIAQAWSPTPEQVVTGADLLSFVNLLKMRPNSAAPGGYKGISFWRADLHSEEIWKAIQRLDIRSSSPTPLETEEKAQLLATNKANEPADDATDIIVDNLSSRVDFSGTWSPRKGLPGKYGANYEVIPGVSGEATATATFIPNIAQEGTYNVYVWYPEKLTKSTTVEYVVKYDGGTDKASVNQTIDGGNWKLIAEKKHFAKGTSGSVMLSNAVDKPGAVVVADAVRFEMVK